MKNDYKIAICGLGSIGRRHLTNTVEVLNQRGSNYTIDLIRSGKGKDLDDDIRRMVNQVFHENDLVPADYDVIFITKPTHLHFETIEQYVGKSRHMFIEKPVFNRTDVDLNVLKLKQDGIYYVACPLRYSDVIQFIKNNIDPGSVYCARVICSSYLPDWRPGLDYREIYSAHKEQGGGVSIDLIHEWDYLCYLFGHPRRVYNLRGKYSNLEISSEDLSLYLAEYPGLAAELHLDYFGRHSIREIQLFMPDDTVVGDLVSSEIRFLKAGRVISFREERNDYHRKEIAHFFDIVEGLIANDNDLASALTTLKIATGEL